MNPYMFVIKGIPLKANRNYDIVAGAYIHIWVMDTDIQSAEHKALDYITNLLWNPLEIEHAFEIFQEQIGKLHTDEFRLYQVALNFGICADFLAYAKENDNPDDPIILGHP